MSVNRWNLLNFILENEKADYIDIMEAFGIKRVTASVNLLRAHRWHWLNRRKIDGRYIYTLSGNAWNFYNEWGTFIHHPWYGFPIRDEEE